ncbi:monovalent cation:proton antiporter-2 (CPA2) family protein [Acinetobacter sp. YH12239]|uniref:monovalent cation:proton antiporter-2 (CPA2) family protein n=1 Tax=Acinetobacter sp. YH12239 TaxID=2601166 RepID=UPI0015D3B085
MPLLLQITIFLAAALILVPLGKKFGIATVLGYLFTGILLGPSALNVTNDAETLMKLAEYGVIFLMFLIGLELRPQRLWNMRHSIFVIGSAQVLITGIILVATIWLFFQQHLAASVVIGIALALSSTAFVMQLLAEKQQLNTAHGQQSFSILLFQDIAAIPLLALIPLLAGNQSTHHGIAYFAAVVATFTGLFLFSRYVMRPFFRFIVQSGATELITAAGLFIVLAVVLFMDMLGLSTTLGAFLTGVLLADSEFRHELESSIQPFKGLLLGLFFMSVGMMTPIDLLVDQPLFIFGGAFVLIIIKILSMVAIARYFKFQWKTSVLIAICLAQGGEFAYVILAVANTEGLITQAVLSPTILIIAISMALTPVIFWLAQRWLIPYLDRKTDSAEDVPLPDTHSTLIIAGFGRVGQIVARVAYLNHVSFTAIDNNLEKIDFVRKYGGKIYYGDASSPDLLRSAGIEHAKAFVLAVDDVEMSMNIARHLRLNYPTLKLIVRARDRHHMHLLKDLGIEHIWRETFLSSLGMAFRTLTALGLSQEHAQHSIEIFRDYDERLLAEQQRIYTDDQKVFESYRNFLAELEQIFENDAQQHQPLSESLDETIDSEVSSIERRAKHSQNQINVCRDEEF